MAVLRMAAPRVGAAGLRVAVLRRLYRVAFRLAQLRAIVLRHRGRGVKCLLTHGHDVLLVLHTYGPRGVWQLPGGAARRGEPPALVAAREMEEELGLRDLEWCELVAVDMRLEHMPVDLTCLHAELAGPLALRPDPVEIAQTRWFAMDELPPRLGAEVGPLLDLLHGRG